MQIAVGTGRRGGPAHVLRFRDDAGPGADLGHLGHDPSGRRSVPFARSLVNAIQTMVRSTYPRRPD
jgi:hypothetical protein